MERIPPSGIIKYLLHYSVKNQYKQIELNPSTITFADLCDKIAKKFGYDDVRDFLIFGDKDKKYQIENIEDFAEFVLAKKKEEDENALVEHRIPNYNYERLYLSQLLSPMTVYPETKFGSGSMGAVFSAQYDGKPVALKLFSPFVNTTEMKNMMRDLMKIRHQNYMYLVNYMYLTASNPSAESQFGIIMELMHGSLLQAIQKTKLDFAQKSECCKQIAQGLEYLHKNGILHRGLSARNCLVTKDFPETILIKLSDYGLPLATEKSSEAAANNTLGILWQSPEYATQKLASCGSDIWSFGVTIWEIFSDGSVPYFKVIDINEYLITLGKRLPKPESCPDELYKLMLLCWQIDTEKRPSSQDILKFFSGPIPEEIEEITSLAIASPKREIEEEGEQHSKKAKYNVAPSSALEAKNVEVKKPKKVVKKVTFGSRK